MVNQLVAALDGPEPGLRPSHQAEVLSIS